MTKIRLSHASAPGGAQLLGFGAYRPEEVLDCEQLGRRFGKSGDWVLARTGMRARRVAAEHEAMPGMAVAAGAEALRDSGLAGHDVDLVILASCSDKQPMRGAATTVAEGLGARGAGAFELNAACAGFCYALTVAADAVRVGSARYVVVVGAEKMTPWLDHDDLGTSAVFADGAGAAVVGPADEAGIGPVAWGSDGSQAELIRIDETDRRLRMAGQSVFRWSTTQVHPIALEACERAGVLPADLAAVVPHQGNMRIVDALARKLGSGHAVVARDGADCGNTSGASIPLALQRLASDRTVGHGALTLLVGFGAGLTYAAQVVRLP